MFTVQARIIACIDTEVQADNLEQAVEIARTLKYADFIEPVGQVADWSLSIGGVFSPDAYDTDQ